MPTFPRINRERFFFGMKYSLVATIIIGILFYFIWLLVTAWDFSLFPVGLFSLAIGGLLLLISGCIGPGRFQREYDLVLHTPEVGSSFSSEIPVSAFTIDESISTATLMINENQIKNLEINDGLISTTVKRDEFINTTLNKIYLKAGEKKSNENYFTLFEYTEDMSDEEIDELYEYETRKPELSLKEARTKYLEKRSTYIGSIALGIFASGILVILFGILYDLIFVVLVNS